jgi:hypothetical protein
VAARGQTLDEVAPQRVVAITQLGQEGAGEIRQLLRQPEQRRHGGLHPVDEGLC